MTVKDLFRRTVVVIAALLISNVAALSCALAFSLCTDCPEPPPIHCVDMCDVVDTAVVDTASDGTANPIYTLLPAQVTHGPYSAVTDTRLHLRHYSLHHPSPPLNLLNCVFLK